MRKNARKDTLCNENQIIIVDEEDIDKRKKFGAAVKSYRGQLGISQEELAWRANLHRTYVSDIERGARNVSLQAIHKLARALEIPVSALFSQAGY